MNKIDSFSFIEHVILLQLCKGASTAEIVVALDSDEKEINEFKDSIYEKMGIKNWDELILFAIKTGQFV